MTYDLLHSKVTLNIYKYQIWVDAALNRFEQDDILNRIWRMDYSVWKPSPQEITNRLAWLDIIDEFSPVIINEMASVRNDLINSGYHHAVLLGMGGSSLAPELFSLIFSPMINGNSSLSLTILDSTCSQSVQDIATHYDLAKTVFIVSTKSGTTEETLSFFKYFYRMLVNRSMQNVGEHFIAITDPGTQLESLANSLNFRCIFLNNPNLGGRYSALSHFGLAPATLCGVEISTLLERAKNMSTMCRQTHDIQNNPAIILGVVLGELAKLGCDKITFIASPTLKPFCDWVEQLIAESTGKENKGILPVVDESLAVTENYSNDRLFVILEVTGEKVDIGEVAEAEFPLIKIRLDDIYDLGGQFILWELATAIAGYCLGINPFDQPNVEATKNNVRQLVNIYKNTGVMPQDEPVFSEAGINYYGDFNATSLKDCLQKFIEQAKSGDYFAVQAFLYPQTIIREKLQDFRISLRDKTKLATTLGFGPRFLHSTGQLHKGDRGNGLFIQISSDFPLDLPIPDSTDSDASSLTFGTLIRAQAMGDYLALRQAGRRVIHFHLDDDPVAAIDQLIQALNSI